MGRGALSAVGVVELLLVVSMSTTSASFIISRTLEVEEWVDYTHPMDDSHLLP
jgi:hypothetical protein